MAAKIEFRKLPIMMNHQPTGDLAVPKVGDSIKFTCNGRGRGGHYSVTASTTKVNRKTLACTEADRSYRPGTQWVVHESQDIVILTYYEQQKA